MVQKKSKWADVSGIAIKALSTSISDPSKADKVIGAIAGHLAGLDGTGNLTDSGIDPATLGGLQLLSITASATPVQLTNASPEIIIVSGTTNQIIILPDATTLTGSATKSFTIINNTSPYETISIKDFSGAIIDEIYLPENALKIYTLVNKTTSAGVWAIYYKLATQLWSGLMSTEHFLKLRQTDKIYDLDTIANNNVIPFYYNKFISSNEIANKTILFPDFASFNPPATNENADGFTFTITATTSTDALNPTTENLIISRQGTTQIYYQGAYSADYVLTEGKEIKCTYFGIPNIIIID